ncbi:MAG: hydrogenase expression/formation protein HypE [Firmicutes bacterium]|jgi:hydrogenase expression/formation protein HypE|nr:hydrogenase expression/formation protein HypE [Bacillota bacterium]
MEERITLAHGAGGEAYRELVQELFLPAYGNEMLEPLTDAAICSGSSVIAMTTDSFVVKPLFFPGGDLGRLCVSGTVNDLAVSGACPKYISVGMIIEAGFAMETLRRLVASIAATAREAGVSVVTGDTKVVEGGAADGIFINTAGIGVFLNGRKPLAQKIAPGDKIIITGYMASHGMAVLAARENMDFNPPIESDVAPLSALIDQVLQADSAINAMRDPTRGGVAATLFEWVTPETDIVIEEQSLPVRPDVAAACAILGMDPLYIANEGIVLLSVPARDAESVLRILQSVERGKHAAIIGEVREGGGSVYALTEYGTHRRIMMPRGELLPRIC